MSALEKLQLAYLTTHLGPYHPPQHLSHTLPSLSKRLCKRINSAAQDSSAWCMCVGGRALWLQSFNQLWGHQRHTSRGKEREREREKQQLKTRCQTKNMRIWGGGEDPQTESEIKKAEKEQDRQARHQRNVHIEGRMHGKQKKHDKHPLLHVHSLTHRQPLLRVIILPPPQLNSYICPRTSSFRIAGASAAAFVLPNNIRRWAGSRDRARFWDGTDAGKECVRPVNTQGGESCWRERSDSWASCGGHWCHWDSSPRRQFRVLQYVGNFPSRVHDSRIPIT